MTDNRTTELLKDYAFALRRLEYAVDKPGSRMTLGEYEAEEKRVTDEYAQAIAATLGNGTLTAEQVSKAVYAHSIHADCADADWQAITNELNATVSNGTCEMVTSGTPCEGNTDVACTCCGAYNIGEYYDGYGHRAAPKFCPECGRAVKR